MTEQISNSDKLACIQRELRMRRKLYPRWIDQDKITAETATREIAVMQAIADDYERLSRLL